MSELHESPQSRLLGAGFLRQMENWTTPDGKRTLSQEAALEALNAGEVEGPTFSLPDSGVRALSDEQVEAMLHPPPPWAALLEAVVDAVREVVRDELRRERRKS